MIIDIDPEFLSSAEWYKKVAKSKPPKDRPCYHILVDGEALRTYMAEQNIEQVQKDGPIHHIDLADYFQGLGNSGYILRNKIH